MKTTVHSSRFTDYSFWKEIICFLILFIFCFVSNAQNERPLVREGNKLYKEKKFSDAEVSYKKSLNVNKESRYGQFNLGNAYYKQGKFDDAIKQFTPLGTDKKFDKVVQSNAYHNIGNSYLQTKKYEESIAAFKNSLKLNPHDSDTRYNLAYAQAMLQKQQQQQKKDKNNQKKDDKKDDKKDQQNEKDKNDQQKKDEQKQAQKQPQKISKEDAEKILQALNNDEKNIQKKAQKIDAKKVVIEKNW